MKHFLLAGSTGMGTRFLSQQMTAAARDLLRQAKEF
jgi:cellobiose-specific phosphotransferase system component IIB